MSHAATSKDRPRIQNSYIAAKQPVMEALWSSRNKCYGTREEHHIMWELFQRLGISSQDIACIRYVNETSPLFAIYPTQHRVEFLYSNILKFANGFEYSLMHDGGQYISIESTKMATMFLHLLRVALGGARLAANSALWIDIGIYRDLNSL